VVHALALAGALVGQRVSGTGQCHCWPAAQVQVVSPYRQPLACERQGLPSAGIDAGHEQSRIIARPPQVQF
jgi:hypothetical protein